MAPLAEGFTVSWVPSEVDVTEPGLDMVDLESRRRFAFDTATIPVYDGEAEILVLGGVVKSTAKVTIDPVPVRIKGLPSFNGTPLLLDEDDLIPTQLV